MLAPSQRRRRTDRRRAGPAQAINDKHREVQALGRTAKEIAAEIGEMLLVEKARAGHGGFKPWIEENCSFSYDTAKDYMNVAKAKRERAPLFNRCISIREFLDLKAKPKTEPAPERRAPSLDELRKVERLRALRDDPAASGCPSPSPSTSTHRSPLAAPLGPRKRYPRGRLESARGCDTHHGQAPWPACTSP